MQERNHRFKIKREEEKAVLNGMFRFLKSQSHRELRQDSRVEQDIHSLVHHFGATTHNHVLWKFRFLYFRGRGKKKSIEEILVSFAAVAAIHSLGFDFWLKRETGDTEPSSKCFVLEGNQITCNEPPLPRHDRPQSSFGSKTGVIGGRCPSFESCTWPGKILLSHGKRSGEERAGAIRSSNFQLSDMLHQIQSSQTS
jgi:hypothetical protein